MCNLYRLRAAKAEIAHTFGLEAQIAGNFAAEVSPNYAGLVIRGREGVVMNWGFPRIPYGKQCQPLKARPVNNARTEKLHTGFWRSSFEERRCLIPVSQWAEPQGEDGQKTRTWYALPGTEPFAVAGIWRPTVIWGKCSTMVMVPNSPQMEEVHDRMPVILRRDDWDTWQYGSPAQAFDLCRTWEGRLMVEQTQDRWSSGLPLKEPGDHACAPEDLPLFKSLSGQDQG